jgi:dolichol-phosphate mannosyltransferase
MLNRCFDPRSTEAGTFSLMDRRVVEVLRRMPERNRYVPALRSLAGFRQTGVVLDRGERYDRRSRVSILRLLRLAIDNWISHSRLPLKLASFAGLFLSVVGFGAIVFIVVYQLWLGFRVSGWASVMVTVIFAGGVQLICLGILGEYVGQVLDEVKGRPVYVVRSLLRGGKAEAPPQPKLEAS